MARRKIVIVGGGFGGLFTSLYLNHLPWRDGVEIVLIDRQDHFLFSPLLYELVTGELSAWEIAPRFSELLENTPIQFQQGEVQRIDLTEQVVMGSGAGGDFQLEYEVLVLAMGNNPPDCGVVGAQEHALPFRTLHDAQRLVARLEELEGSGRDKIRVCVAGGGASGVELACKVSDRLQRKGETRGRVRIIDRNPYLLKNSPLPNRRAAEVALQDRGIWQDLSTRVVAITEDSITLDYGGTIEALPVDLVLWAVGNTPHPLGKDLAQAGADIKDGKPVITPTLQLVGHAQVFAIGDTAYSDLPATAQAAFQQAGYCAKNIWAYLHGEEMVPFTYVPLGEFVSLGMGQATMAVPFLPFGLTGSFPNLLRRAVYLTRMPTLSHQVRVGLNWLSDWLTQLQEQVK
jgi:NADH dehydrogenase